MLIFDALTTFVGTLNLPKAEKEATSGNANTRMLTMLFISYSLSRLLNGTILVKETYTSFTRCKHPKLPSWKSSKLIRILLFISRPHIFYFCSPLFKYLRPELDLSAFLPFLPWSIPLIASDRFLSKIEFLGNMPADCRVYSGDVIPS